MQRGERRVVIDRGDVYLHVFRQSAPWFVEMLGNRAPEYIKSAIANCLKDDDDEALAMWGEVLRQVRDLLAAQTTGAQMQRDHRNDPTPTHPMDFTVSEKRAQQLKMRNR